MIYGNFLSSMALRSGAPTFGTPEPAIGSLVVGQLARRVGLPLRCSGVVHHVEGRSTARRCWSRRCRCRRRSCAAPTSSSTRPAGWRAGWRWATRSSSSTPTTAARCTRYLRGIDLSDDAVRPRRASARSGRASTSSAPSTRCATTRRRSGTAGRPTTRASSSGATPASGGSRSGRPTRWPSCWPPTNRRRSTPPSTQPLDYRRPRFVRPTWTPIAMWTDRCW